MGQLGRRRAASSLALVTRQGSSEKRDRDGSVYEARLGAAKVEVLSDMGRSGGSGGLSLGWREGRAPFVGIADVWWSVNLGERGGC